MKKNVAIVGASGYTGIELIKLLINHPKFHINYVATSSGGEKLSTLHPAMQNVFECDVEKANIEDIAKNDLVFLAVPHKTAMEFVKELSKYKIKIVDFSADYRLTKDHYEEYYCPHIDVDNLKNAVYGLPEMNRTKIKNASLIANPGCYPTASLLGMLPFLEFITGNIFIDAKSGVSGAGKKLTETNSFVTINDNMFAYNPIKHRHSVEIKEKSGFEVNFVPHLIPVTRGMLVSIYVTLTDENIDALEILKDHYVNEEFVRIREKPVDIKAVSGTNFADIFVMQNRNSLFINVAIDNLLRGASSQAIVNANLMMGYEENLGINSIAYIP
jgi:N-acetyl-gamma-glutamyl-phosphate reductase